MLSTDSPHVIRRPDGSWYVRGDRNWHPDIADTALRKAKTNPIALKDWELVHLEGYEAGAGERAAAARARAQDAQAAAEAARARAYEQAYDEAVSAALASGAVLERVQKWIKHVVDLAREDPPIPITWMTFDSRARALSEGEANARTCEIVTPAIVTLSDYTTALHELFHLRLPSARGKGIDFEVAAWEAARLRALEWNEIATEGMGVALATYLEHEAKQKPPDLAAIVRGEAFLKRWNVPPLKMKTSAIVHKDAPPIAGPDVSALQAQLDAAIERVKALEARPVGLRFVGVWQRGVTFQKDDGTVHHGSTWAAVRETNREPGTPDSGWILIAKRGRDAREKETK
jgi:hypothetical protein